MVLDITWFKDGSQKCIDIIYIIYTFLFGYNAIVKTNTVSALDPSSSVIKRLWCNNNNKIIWRKSDV